MRLLTASFCSELLDCGVGFPNPLLARNDDHDASGDGFLGYYSLVFFQLGGISWLMVEDYVLETCCRPSLLDSCFFGGLLNV